MAKLSSTTGRPLSNFNSILKVNEIDAEKYKHGRITDMGFKKYSPGPSFEDDVIPNEGVICEIYGCKKPLSLRQQMAGERCEDHPKEVKTYSNPLL